MAAKSKARWVVGGLLLIGLACGLGFGAGQLLQPIRLPGVVRPELVASVEPAPSQVPALSLLSALPSASAAPPQPDPALLAELAKTTEDLLALRDTPLAPDSGTTDGCGRFESAGITAVREAHGGADASSYETCAAGTVKNVRCLETPTGFFVPAATTNGICAYRLWFVPRAGADKPLPVSERWDEFDLQFTTRMAAEDLDADGVVEAIVARGWEHPEGVGDGVTLFLFEPTGEQTMLPFDDLVPGDPTRGLDALLEFGTTVNAAGCEPPDKFEAWVAAQISAPSLLLERVAPNRFSLQTPRARAWREASCEKRRGELVVRAADGLVDEQETYSRAVCQLADGADPVAVQRALEKACSGDFERPADCKKRRPGACFWRSTLLGVAERFDALKPWLDTSVVTATGGAGGNDHSRPQSDHRQ